MKGCAGLRGYITVCTFPLFSLFPFLHGHQHIPNDSTRLKSSLWALGHYIYLILPHRCLQSNFCDSGKPSCPSSFSDWHSADVTTSPELRYLLETCRTTLWRFFIGEGAGRMLGKVSGEWSVPLPSAWSSDWLEPYSVTAPSHISSLGGIWIIETIQNALESPSESLHPLLFPHLFTDTQIPALSPPSPIPSFITLAHRLYRTSSDYRWLCCILGHCHLPLPGMYICIFVW
jgi:hypothetical protein